MLTEDEVKEIGTDYIYRFRSNNSYNYEALIKNELYASTPNILNDPLDCCLNYDLDVLYKKLIKRKSFISFYAIDFFASDDGIKANDFDTYEEYENYASQKNINVVTRLLDPNNKEIVKEKINRLAKKALFEIRECFCVVSFSKDYKSNIMWSHYASNYEGFVASYNLKNMNKILNDFIDGNYYAKKYRDIYGLHVVKYLPMELFIDSTNLMYEIICKRIMEKNKFKKPYDYIMDSKYRNLFISLLTTKDKSWEYENEIRLILPAEIFRTMEESLQDEYTRHVFKISEKYCPNEIIIGDKMSNTNRAIIGYYHYANKGVPISILNTKRLISDKILSKDSIDSVQYIK
ncbi:MAG: DUF2971 domain-containing protein [Clostridia bacterium]|nr:DUF2971 domain-containing protein [Clostridia bacterium]